MKLSAPFLKEFRTEAPHTRKVLERMPMDKPAYKPHEKSTELGGLAVHVAELPGWITMVLNTDELDFAKSPYKPAPVADTAALVQLFDDKVTEAAAALEAASDETMEGDWTLRHGDHVILTLPRKDVLRTMVFNHSIHHRAQLGVYLRLNDIPVPGIYGPSADER